ncbi:MAG: SecD/SecF family protein translocase subunit [Oscillospiraceae bacterium]|nr:SecD/SecF family protein translocase subunit [Oscillospiraceae bacterium]
MKKVGKPVFFIVALLIFALTALSFTGIYTQYGDITTTHIKGVQDVRWGIDIRGGVDVTFFPSGDYQATSAEMVAAEAVIRQRLLVQNITDYELYPDHDRNRIILRFPWRADEVDFNPIRAIEELGATAMLTFREGVEVDEYLRPAGHTAENIVLTGSDVASARADMIQNEFGVTEFVVDLVLHESGRQAFSEATGRMIGQQISIWMDDDMLSAPVVRSHLTDGRATISGDFTAEEAGRLADQITGGALPFSLETDNYNTISPTLGMGALQAMVLAGVIAFALISLYMVFQYRASGFVAVIGLVGQLGLMIAAVTGFFPFVPSFVLTLPGIAGIILSIAMGVDANIITAERIREELYQGKTLDGAVASGYRRAFTAIFDGNITVIIVAVILMGAFGPSGSLFASMLRPVFFMFGPTTAGAIYSFGYTLLVGVIANFVMGVFACRLMQRSLCRIGPMRNPWLFGGAR